MPLHTFAFLCIPLHTFAYVCMLLHTFAKCCVRFLPFLSFRFLCFRYLSFRLLSLQIIKKSSKNPSKIHQKSSKMEPKSIKNQPKWLPKPIRAPRSIWDAQNGAKIDPKWSQWCQNGPKTEPKGLQNRCKIASKSTQKSMPKKLRKIMPKWHQNDAKMAQQVIKNLTFPRN